MCWIMHGTVYTQYRIPYQLKNTTDFSPSPQCRLLDWTRSVPSLGFYGAYVWIGRLGTFLLLMLGWPDGALFHSRTWTQTRSWLFGCIAPPAHPQPRERCSCEECDTCSCRACVVLLVAPSPPTSLLGQEWGQWILVLLWGTAQTFPNEIWLWYDRFPLEWVSMAHC